MCGGKSLGEIGDFILNDKDIETLFMCGIAGFIVPQKINIPAANKLLQRANAAQKFRGPNGQHFWTDGYVGLAHVRLAILSEKSGGTQPEMDPWGGRLVYNGEVYDYLSILSDNAWVSSEYCGEEGVAIAGLLEKHGPNGLKKQRGMFAVVRYHPKRRSVLLVRDAYGQKPLYIARWREGWIFASTIAAIHSFKGALHIRERAIQEYLIYRSVGGCHSAWEGIEQVPPGGWIELGLDGSLKKGYWYHYPTMMRGEANTQAVYELVMRAIAARIPPALSAKCYLSGGLDSAIVAYGCAKSRASSHVEALSIGYEQPGYEDESDSAQKLADFFGLKFNRLLLKSTQLPALIMATTRALEDPIQDPVCVASLLLAQHVTQQGIKVAFSGDGSDEGWGGYARYEQLPSTLEDYLPRLWVFLPKELGLKEAPSTYFDDIQMPDVSLPMINQVIQFELAVRFRNYHLARLDKISMSVGLEMRCPFLDPAVMHCAIRLLEHARRPHGRAKGLLLDAFAHVLPPGLIHRKKQPFTLPINAWLQGSLKEFTHDLLMPNASFVQNYFPVKELLLGQNSRVDKASIMLNHSYCPASIEHKIWSLLMLECWHQQTKHWRL